MTRPKTPTRRGTEPPARPSRPEGAFEDDNIPTDVYEPTVHGKKPKKGAPGTPAPTPAQAPKTQVVAISMKTPADPRLAPVKVPEREMPHIRLRALSEVSRAQQPENLGNLAPPYNPDEARKKTFKEYLLWGSVAVMLACGIAIVVWFVAT